MFCVWREASGLAGEDERVLGVGERRKESTDREDRRASELQQGTNAFHDHQPLVVFG